MQYEVIVTTFGGLKNMSKQKRIKALFDIHSIEKRLGNKLKIFPASKAGIIRTKLLYQKLLVIFCFDSKECWIKQQVTWKCEWNNDKKSSHKIFLYLLGDFIILIKSLVQILKWLTYQPACTLKYGLPWWFSGTESTCQSRRCGFSPWVGKIP